MTQLTGKYNSRESWIKQSYFDLSNGYQVCIEHNQAYGELVTSISGNGDIWHACNGRDSLPDHMKWAMSWVVPIAEGHWQHVMVPNFERVC